MGFKVAIVGRPNVGKSALFNRIAGRSASLVHKMEGVTRDRLFADCVWQGKKFTLIDTGGLDVYAENQMASAIRAQIQEALNEADLLIFAVDTRKGLTPQDLEVADVLRKTKKKIIVAANKCETREEEIKALEFTSMGFEKIFPVSALHGLGVGELLDEVVKEAGEEENYEPSSVQLEDAIRVAIVGKPNVGKSSLVNALLGKERMTVSEMPGTTLDAVDTLFRMEDRSYIFVDTAGLRRPAKISEKIEELASRRSLSAIKKAHVAVLMLDGSEKPSAQDRRIAGFIQQNGKASVVVVNKVDLGFYEGFSRKDFESLVRHELRPIWYSPVLFTSLKTQKGVERVLPAVDEVFAQYSKRIETSLLNRVVQEIAEMRRPPLGVRFFYATQVGIKPPHFIFFAKHPDLVKEDYMRYLESEIRKRFGFSGTALVLELRARESNNDSRRK